MAGKVVNGIKLTQLYLQAGYYRAGRLTKNQAGIHLPAFLTGKPKYVSG